MKPLIDEAYVENDEDVYLRGFGFLPSNPRDLIDSKIKKYAYIFSISIISYFILNKILLYPIDTFFQAHIFPHITLSGTGVAIDAMKNVANIISITITIIVCYLLNMDFYKKLEFFPKMHFKNLTTTLSITLCFWVVANLSIVVIEDIFKFIGIINIPALSAIDINQNTAQLNFCLILIKSVVQEIFFRGIVLFKLREYGDSFAIVATSLLFSISMIEFLLMFKFFILSLALCYFTLKTNSVTIAIITRVLCSLSFQIVQILMGSIDVAIAYFLTVVASGVVLVIGVVDYFELDFKLYDDTNDIKSVDKIIMFMSSLPFIILVLYTFFVAQGGLEFVG